MKTLSMVETVTIPLRTDADGVVRVGGTRVPLDTVVAAFEQGATAEEIALQYDVLDLADIYVVIGYCLRHREEIADYLKKRDAFRAEVRRQNESQNNPVGIRARLLARSNSGKGLTTC